MQITLSVLDLVSFDSEIQGLYPFVLSLRLCSPQFSSSHYLPQQQGKFFIKMGPLVKHPHL